MQSSSTAELGGKSSRHCGKNTGLKSISTLHTGSVADEVMLLFRRLRKGKTGPPTAYFGVHS